LLVKTQDEIWDFFEKLAGKTYHLEQANETLRYPIHGQYAFYVNPHRQYHFMDPYNHLSYSYMPPVSCDY